MKILFFGTPGFAAASLQALMRSSHQVIGVVTQPDRPKGRGNQLAASPIKEAAHAGQIPIHQPTDLKEAFFLQTIHSLKPDAAVVVAYGRILPKSLLDLFPKGVFNLHASLLPRYRGAAPIQWAIIRGETETGVTIFQLDEQLDHGPIVLQAKQPIQADDDAVSLSSALAQLGAQTIVQAMDIIQAGKASLTPQKDSAATHAPILKKEDGIIRWEADSRTIHNLVRGVQPWPGAMTRLDGKLLKILAATADPSRHDVNATPGTMTLADPQKGLWVQTGTGQLRIQRLQMEGGNPVSAEDFLRGHPTPPGTSLTSK